MGDKDDARKAATALVTYIKAQPEPVLERVLSEFGIAPKATKVDRRHCGVCGLRFPEHERRWARDHEFELVVR